MTDDDLRAAVDTLAAHTRPGGQVVIVTMLKPILGGGRSTLNDEFVTATVESQSSWDADSGIVTTRRTWIHQDGRVDEDLMHRRVTPLDELTDLLTEAGFAEIARLEEHQTVVAGRRI